MGFKMKGHSLPGIKQRVESSPARKMGSFIDGERVTYAEARAAEKDPNNKSQVVHTNKEAENASADDARQAIKDGKQKETYTGQDGATHSNPGLDLAKAQKNISKGGNQEDIHRDRVAQDILENSTKAKNNANLWKSTGGKEGIGPRVAGDYDEDGFKGSNRSITEKKKFLENNSKLEVTNGSAKGVRSQYSPNANESGKDIMGFQEAQGEKKKRNYEAKMALKKASPAKQKTIKEYEDVKKEANNTNPRFVYKPMKKEQAEAFKKTPDKKTLKKASPKQKIKDTGKK